MPCVRGGLLGTEFSGEDTSTSSPKGSPTLGPNQSGRQWWGLAYSTGVAAGRDTALPRSRSGTSMVKVKDPRAAHAPGEEEAGGQGSVLSPCTEGEVSAEGRMAQNQKLPGTWSKHSRHGRSPIRPPTAPEAASPRGGLTTPTQGFWLLALPLPQHDFQR